MGKIVIKKIRPSLTAQRFYKFGRQSNVRGVYEDRPIITTQEKTKVQPKAKEEKPVVAVEENKEKKEDNVMLMDTKQKIELANEILSEEAQIKAKRLKKDKGLIERKENTIVLTEDNRELLKD